MKMIKVILPILLCAVWCYLLNRPIHLKELSLPAPGKFFSPFEGFWNNGTDPLSVMTDNLRNQKCEGKVYFDERAVPHIEAPTLHDAYYIQGYVHAMHRLWQMDFSTRAAEGRISEIIGAKAIEFDKIKRRKGLAEAARRSLVQWQKEPAAYALLESYCDGVNAYISSLSPRDYPLEFKLLSYAPEPWSPYRSALFHKSMSEVLAGRDSDVELNNAQHLFGSDFNLLFPEDDPDLDPVIPKGTKWGFSCDSLGRVTMDSNAIEFLPVPVDTSPSGLGSNNWAINSAKSASGHPVLCNDPHLMLTLPSIWYEQQIITPDCNVYGVTFAGIPGVVIGFNHNIAWGITNAGWDVQDWYKIQWSDEQHSHYILDGNKTPVQHRVEKILVSGQDPVFDTILLTNWGPVVYTQTSQSRYGLAMHWIIQDSFAMNDLNTFIGLNRAENYNDYRNAVRNFSYPAQNIAYADRFGHIALTVQGEMPLKKNQQGRLISDGSDSHNRWSGFLPLSLNPHTLDPARGFISSANQKSTDHTFPVYYNNGDFREWRGSMINRLLNNKEKWSVEELQKLQFNNHSLLAESALPLMIKHLDSALLNEKEKNFCNSLRVWNCDYDSSSIEAVRFDLWFNKFHRIFWDEITADSLMKYTQIPSERVTIQLMKDHADNKYTDIVRTPEKESLYDILRMSLDSAIEESALITTKTWGMYKATKIEHIAKIPAFSIPVISTSGSKDIINACWKTWGPSWRMVVELTENGPVAYGVYPGGQDGQPGHSHYMDMIETWRKGEYYSLKYCTGLRDLENIAKHNLQFQKS